MHQRSSAGEDAAGSPAPSEGDSVRFSESEDGGDNAFAPPALPVSVEEAAEEEITGTGYAADDHVSIAASVIESASHSQPPSPARSAVLSSGSVGAVSVAYDKSSLVGAAWTGPTVHRRTLAASKLSAAARSVQAMRAFRRGVPPPPEQDDFHEAERFETALVGTAVLEEELGDSEEQELGDDSEMARVKRRLARRRRLREGEEAAEARAHGREHGSGTASNNTSGPTTPMALGQITFADAIDFQLASMRPHSRRYLTETATAVPLLTGGAASLRRARMSSKRIVIDGGGGSTVPHVRSPLHRGAKSPIRAGGGVVIVSPTPSTGGGFGDAAGAVAAEGSSLLSHSTRTRSPPHRKTRPITVANDWSYLSNGLMQDSSSDPESDSCGSVGSVRIPSGTVA